MSETKPETVEQRLLLRKTQFEDFLAKTLPKDKQVFLAQLKTQNVTEFVLFFRKYIIPKYHENKMEAVVDYLMNLTGVDKKDFKPEDVTKFGNYLLAFCSFILKCYEPQS